MTKFYVSGRISGIPLPIAKMNFELSCKEVRKYHNAGVVVNPFNIKPFLGIKRWLFYMIADIYRQSKCTHTAFRPDWKESRGAVIEYFFAKFIFKQIVVFL
jgi:hypothetical protein